MNTLHMKALYTALFVETKLQLIELNIRCFWHYLVGGTSCSFFCILITHGTVCRQTHIDHTHTSFLKPSTYKYTYSSI